MANTWTKNLGIDGFCSDCSGNYAATPSKGCPTGMMQTGKPADPLKPFAKIIDRVREKQPQVRRGEKQPPAASRWSSTRRLLT